MDKYLIVGAGRSGIAAAQLLEKVGIDYSVYDGNENLDVQAVKAKIGTEKEIEFLLGGNVKVTNSEYSVCVVSPGVSLETEIMQAVQSANIPIWSEIELAYRYDKGAVVAITGTNGKTTTTSLVHKIVNAYFKNTLLVGNIEIPYTGLALESREGGCTVAEISSFQLETMLTVKPRVCAVLNITPDHLDRHKTMENYGNIKKSIAKNQTKDDFCILNYDDAVLRSYAPECPGTVIFFSSQAELSNGVYFKEGEIFLAENGTSRAVMKTSELNLVGIHNFENVCAAIAMTYYLGVPMDIIVQQCSEFTAVEHRIEFTAEKYGVKYYNDSKGTNTDAAIKAIDAMPSKTVLIAGGYDKHADYDEWISHLFGKCKLLVLMGQTREKIAAACDKAGFAPYCFVESMQEAVLKAKETAESGDCVLLSPACASWGMFKCYQQRGEIFKELVRKIEE